MLNLDDTIKAFRCCTQTTPDCANCPEQGPGFGIECRNDVKAYVLIWLKAQEPETAEVKWQDRHRKSYRQYTGFDARGDEHTVTVSEDSEGLEPYCGKCSAQLAESFTNYCPRCGVKLLISSLTAEQREARV